MPDQRLRGFAYAKAGQMPKDGMATMSSQGKKTVSSISGKLSVCHTIFKDMRCLTSGDRVSLQALFTAKWPKALEKYAQSCIRLRLPMESMRLPDTLPLCLPACIVLFVAMVKRLRL